MENVARARSLALTREIHPGNAQANNAVWADDFGPELLDGLSVERDLAYGDDERHRLDVYTDGRSASPRPVIVFLHGGNFVAGAKHTDGTPFYDNVGAWAAHNGYVGVVSNYRLAPAHRFPSGIEDVESLVSWLREHVAEHDGDPSAIFLMGASAGATQIAHYVSSRTASDTAIAGAMLLSGRYDYRTLPLDAVLHNYYGDSPDLEEISPLPRLVETRVPLMVAITEFDPPEIQAHFVRLIDAYLHYTGTLPRICYLAGHNHFSEVTHLAGGDEALGTQVKGFVAACLDAAREAVA
ncbi:alpha/beta hydrolase [Microbacterium album]|uniref:BD-FAE-like domain-containing protein n=1 Tax=Microbacterium album TaxID=2053191 RepID=A0A917MKV8_9MICO|nr:alpha/beta hydrolase [Microbacterium album]GGH37011.1 hypothetical protein GCM10010921_06570 [Microbacterium album]